MESLSGEGWYGEKTIRVQSVGRSGNELVTRTVHW